MRNERLVVALRGISFVAAGAALSWACGSNPGFGNDAGNGNDASNDVNLASDCSFCGVDTSTKETGPVYDPCHVPPDNSGDNAPQCTAPPAPPNSFTPVSKWTWSEPTNIQATESIKGSMVIPLVADMVDTNNDGEVNLCDTPSVIVTTGGGQPSAVGYAWMLSGDKGVVQAQFEGNVDASLTPALADLDGDKVPEVVFENTSGHIVVYDNKGKIKWTGPDTSPYGHYYAAIAIYDLDEDGTPEIIAGSSVFDSHGKLLWSNTLASSADSFGDTGTAPTAADLDNDGKLEVIFSNAVYHYDGTLYWQMPAGTSGMPQVADLNNDGLPEIFMARADGLQVLTYDGKQIIAPTQSFDPGNNFTCWHKPAAVGDFDGTGHPSLMDASCSHFGIWHVGTSALTLQWSQPIDDPSGVAGSTAFDFLGRGIADAVYGDQGKLWVYDGKSGSLEFSEVRNSGTLIEYPVVVDVDNDGSADILVVSNDNGSSGVYQHTLEVFHDAQNRWAPTRRIWNQHAYHVTNVREDGTIPQHPKASWKYTNTFRMNAQVQAGGDCQPPPPNPN
jgi:hypothetical protein